MIRHSTAIALTELRLGVRNRWVILATLMLLTFACVLGFLGAAPVGDVKANHLSITIVSLATLSVYLVPLLALLVSFDGIAGEIDRGTLQLVLATPVSRAAVLIGKFAGQLLVVALAITIGYGIACVLIAWIGGVGLSNLSMALRLILSSIALGAAFIAISLIASTLVRHTGTAAAVAVGLWLFCVVLYDLGLLGLLVADSDGMFSQQVFPWLLLANPADAFRLFNIAALDFDQSAGGLFGATEAMPFPPVFALVSIALWVVFALTIAIFSFRRVEP